MSEEKEQPKGENGDVKNAVNKLPEDEQKALKAIVEALKIGSKGAEQGMEQGPEKGNKLPPKPPEVSKERE